jgi:hypothetical protein
MLINIECIKTNDLTGNDELVGRFDNLSAADFQIGIFNCYPGNKQDLNMQIIIPVGATTLNIIEKDLTGDDLLGTINLTEKMSVENETKLLNDSAEYVLSYLVTEGD